jgi:hypothetical protein
MLYHQNWRSHFRNGSAEGQVPPLPPQLHIVYAVDEIVYSSFTLARDTTFLAYLTDTGILSSDSTASLLPLQRM